MTDVGRLRLLLDGSLSPARNMAVDEALLLAGTEPTLRLYGWRPHAVSLGYFQRSADFADLPPDVPLVRRLTGGGAIWHGEELTFSLTLDAVRLPRDVAASYDLLHDAAVRALASIDVASRRLESGAPQAARPEARWCFAHPGCGDVVTERGKLLGSAQRRIRRPRPRVLHHGSLVLQRPAATPFVAAVFDERPEDAEALAMLQRALTSEIGRALGLIPEPGELTESERGLVAELEPRYTDPTFLHRR